MYPIIWNVGCEVFVRSSHEEVDITMGLLQVAYGKIWKEELDAVAS